MNYRWVNFGVATGQRSWLSKGESFILFIFHTSRMHWHRKVRLASICTSSPAPAKWRHNLLFFDLDLKYDLTERSTVKVTTDNYTTKFLMFKSREPLRRMSLTINNEKVSVIGRNLAASVDKCMFSYAHICLLSERKSCFPWTYPSISI